MTNAAVHWADGLFLRPHHFQALERNLREEIAVVQSWGTPYGYGFHRLEVAEDALADWRVLLRNCHLSLRDGTRLRFPEDALLDPLDLPKNLFDGRDRVLIYVGAARTQLGRRNVDWTKSDPLARFEVESLDSVDDENEPGNPQPLNFKRPRLRLFYEGQNLNGYEVLPLMKLRRGSQPESPPEPDREFIPPVLCCEASSILKNDIIDSITAYISGQVEEQSRAMFDRKVAFESGHREDLEIIFQLHSLNTVLGFLIGLPQARGVHPLAAYLELSRAVGQLAIFRPERRMPTLPLYDHDDLGNVFFSLKRWLTESKKTVQPIKRPFIGAGLQLQAKLEKEWLEHTWSFFVGVESSLPYHDVLNLVRSDLNMKVGSARQVQQIFAMGRSGVKPDPDPNAPRALPGRNWTYFKVDRTVAAWKDVEDTLNIGIRINEAQVEGRIDGAEQLRVKLADGRTTKIAFALYALPAEANQ